jgi:hypothetical protein
MGGGAMDRDQAGRRSAHIVRACLCLCVIVCGLTLRGIGLQLGLPAFVVKYGGSVLWGTMVFFLVAMSASNLSRPGIALVAAMIAISVELFRLVHLPWLDAFRLTLPGALLLGRVFSVWNMVAYGVGIGLGLWLDRSAGADMRRRFAIRELRLGRPPCDHHRERQALGNAFDLSVQLLLITSPAYTAYLPQQSVGPYRPS